MAATPNYTMNFFFIYTCSQLFIFLCTAASESPSADSPNLDGVRLVMPSAVLAGSTTTLLCLFEAEEDESPLYAVKWYRGSREFYRYVPRERPPKRSFAFPGILIDLSASDRHQVTLHGVPLHLSGSFSCEVSLDAPKFTTVTARGSLLVLEPPAHKPLISINPLSLHPGETFKANCSAATSKIEPKLEFYINNKLVPSQMLITWPFGAGLQFAPGSELFMPTSSVDELDPGRLTTAMIMSIRCVASVPGVYRIASSQMPVWLHALPPPPPTSPPWNPWSHQVSSSSQLRYFSRSQYFILLNLMYFLS